MKPLTEAEAATKWCPLARSVGGENRWPDGNPISNTHCLGSRCMWWQGDGAGRGYCGAVGASWSEP